MNSKQPAGEKRGDKEENGDANQCWTDLDGFNVCVKGCSFALCTNHSSKPVAGFPPLGSMPGKFYMEVSHTYWYPGWVGGWVCITVIYYTILRKIKF